MDFYDNFLKDKLISFSDYKIFGSPKSTRVIDNARKLFPKIKFVAIDGTCFKENMDPYMVFFSCAYAVQGEIKINSDHHKVKYEKWSVEQDKSVVSFLPVPYADLTNFMQEKDIIDDERKIDFINIHLDLMKLAEIYLAYSMTMGDSRPNLVLLDQSISSSFNAQGIGRKPGNDSISFLNKSILGVKIDKYDLLIAYTHPYNLDLGMPPPKDFKLSDYIISSLTNASNHRISYDFCLKNIPQTEKAVGDIGRIKWIKRRIENYINRDNDVKLIEFDDNKREIKLNSNYVDSWARTKVLFELICRSLFEEKESNENSGMIYTTIENGESKKHWFTPDDIKFFLALGYRVLIEACWKYNILLIGIAKDSSTAYFSRNYFNIFQNHNTKNDFEIYDFQDNLGNLPWTDRLLLEAISFFKPDLISPWTTIEMDSAIITLRKKFQSDNQPIIKGSGSNFNIYYPERIFARSLAQFYINRSKTIPTAGHVIFIDRLFLPKIERKLKTINLGKPSDMEIFFFKDKSSSNIIQEIMIFLLDILTKNLFPEVIGYPDPLHKADWGAKSLGDKIRPMIKSSQIILKGNPLIKKLRTLRSEGGNR